MPFAGSVTRSLRAHCCPARHHRLWTVWQPDQVTDAGMIELFDDLADRVRNPMLAYLGTPEDRGDWGDDSPTEVDLLAERRLLGAVMLASIHIIDECIDDIQAIGSAEAEPDGDLDPEIYADTFVWDNFPPRFRASYDSEFFAKVLVSAVKVSHDLANPNSERPACIAEEIIVNAICKYAYALMDDAGVECEVSLEDLILDDDDFDCCSARTWTGSRTTPPCNAPSACGSHPSRLVHPIQPRPRRSSLCRDQHDIPTRARPLPPTRLRRTEGDVSQVGRGGYPHSDHRAAANQRSRATGTPDIERRPRNLGRRPLRP